jgi:hypothetical protein
VPDDQDDEALDLCERILSMEVDTSVASMRHLGRSGEDKHGTTPRRVRGVRAAFTGAAAALVVVLVIIGAVMSGSSSLKDGAGGIPNSGNGKPTAVLDARTVVYKTTAAIAQARGTGIEYIHETYTGGPTGSLTVDLWYYGSDSRLELFSTPGVPGIDDSSTVENGVRDSRLVNYSTRTWRPGAQFPTTELSQLDVANQIRSGLAGGLLHVIGRTTLDGEPAFELTGAGAAVAGIATFMPFDIANSNVRSTPGASVTLFVDATTYLPIERILRLPGGMTQTATVTWLSPTASNLNLLIAQVPAGFTESAAAQPATKIEAHR